MVIFKLNLLFLFILFIFSSNDIFFNLSINDFNVRTLYFLELFFLIFLFKNFISVNQKKLFLIYLWPFLYLFLTMINYNNFTYEFLFFFLIMASVLLIPLIYLLSKPFSIELIYNLYVNSFFLISIFGFIQFLFGLFSFDILLTQKWPNGIPRINGLNYEPSFFATYLYIIWSSLTYLLFKNRFYFQRKFKKRYYFITLILILSSSRMAIMLMFFSFFFLFAYLFCKNLKSKFILKSHLIIFIFFLFCSIFVLMIIYKNNYLLNGLGIFNVHTFSVDERFLFFDATFEIFKSNYLLGVGFYNLPLEMSSLIECESWKKCQGMGTWIEVFAASGLSFIPIVFFIINYFRYNSSFVNNKEYQVIYESLLFSLIVLIILLSFNQNIFRPYFWILLAVLFAFKRKIYEYK